MVEKSSNVPRIVDRLVAKKLVKRHQSKEDKRETLIVLTEKGIDITQKARELVDGHTSKSVNLSEEEASTLNMLLEKLREPMQQTN
jgi:DNA-binding MarR family transcriptional regulator